MSSLCGGWLSTWGQIYLCLTLFLDLVLTIRIMYQTSTWTVAGVGDICWIQASFLKTKDTRYMMRKCWIYCFLLTLISLIWITQIQSAICVPVNYLYYCFEILLFGLQTTLCIVLFCFCHSTFSFGDTL